MHGIVSVCVHMCSESKGAVALLVGYGCVFEIAMGCAFSRWLPSPHYSTTTSHYPLPRPACAVHGAVFDYLKQVRDVLIRDVLQAFFILVHPR